MFTKQQFKDFRSDVEKALEEVSKKYNVNIKAGNITYSNISFNLKLEVTKKEVNGKSFEQAEFEKYAILYGFKPSDYNKQFAYGGKKYVFIGFKPKSHKYPILAKCTNGKTYKFPIEIVKMMIA